MHALAESGWRGHGQTGGGQAPLAPFGGQLQQLAGVVAGQHAGGDHRVVGGQFGLTAQGLGGLPDQGIGPIKGAGDQRQGLGQTVAAAHVSQLVAQHRRQAFRRPVERFVGQHDHRAQHAPGHWAGAVFGHEQGAAAHRHGRWRGPGHGFAAYQLQAGQGEEVLDAEFGEAGQPDSDGQGDQSEPAKVGGSGLGHGRRDGQGEGDGRRRGQSDHRQAWGDEGQQRQAQQHGEGGDPHQPAAGGTLAIGFGE